MDALTEYVINNYRHLMTPRETTAHKNLIYEEKAKANEARYAETAELIRRNWISRDPAVLDLLRDGTEAFFLRVRDRILREHAAEVVVRRCPRCDHITRRPSSRQCFACGHEWNDPEPQGES
jgi:hypothetical protein